MTIRHFKAFLAVALGTIAVLIFQNCSSPGNGSTASIQPSNTSSQAASKVKNLLVDVDPSGVHDSGAPFQLRVVAEDANGAIVTDFTGSAVVNFSGMVTCNHTFQFVNGILDVQVTAIGGSAQTEGPLPIIVSVNGISPVSNPMVTINPLPPVTAQVMSLSTPGPSARMYHTALYDSAHKRMLLFGGRSGFDGGGYEAMGTAFDETWSLDLSVSPPAWSNLTSGIRPPARFGHIAFIDSAHSRMLIYGGINQINQSLTSYNDVWAFDLNSSTWSQLNPSGQPPSPRYNFGSGLDLSANQLVVSGGQSFSLSGTLGDTFGLLLGGSRDGAWVSLSSTPITANLYPSEGGFAGNRDRESSWSFAAVGSEGGMCVGIPNDPTCQTGKYVGGSNQIGGLNGFYSYQVNDPTITWGISGASVIADPVNHQFLMFGGESIVVDNSNPNLPNYRRMAFYDRLWSVPEPASLCQ